MMVASVERNFLNLKRIYELFMVNNNSREVKWLNDSIFYTYYLINFKITHNNFYTSNIWSNIR